MEVSEILVLRSVIGICFLIFVAKMFAGMCNRYGVPGVVGEVLAGTIFGPYALGGFMIFFGEPLIEINEIILSFAQIGGIIVIFVGGLEFTFSDIRHAGAGSLVIALIGAIVSFFTGFYVTVGFGYPWEVAILVGVALTATSLAIHIRALEDMGVLRLKASKVAITASVIDDIICLAILSMAVSVVFAGEILSLPDVLARISQALIIWTLVLVVSSYSIPQMINATKLWQFRGTVEAVALGVCFGLAFVVTLAGLSPFVGAFAAGMAIAGSGILKRVKEYVEHLYLMFGTLFFVMAGALIDVRTLPGINLPFFFALMAMAIISKVLACGLPATVLLRDLNEGLRVGLGMFARGEMGILVAGLGFTTGFFDQSVYSSLLLVILISTVLSPMLMKKTAK